ncbi:MAG TPA: hypothetical protein VJ742_07320 [Nitrososphaera sp.]|jgi:hypothetical protein|nr:hypothetical protein [Nitrososphaera sp.]
MSDFALPIWLMLSWIIRQIENETGNEDPDEEESVESDETPVAEVELEPYEPIEQAIKIGIAVFSILLAGLSVYAYKRTAIKGIIYAAVAFGLFAVQMLFEYLEDEVEGFDAPYNDIIFLGMTLAILALFFLAIVWRKSTISK